MGGRATSVPKYFGTGYQNFCTGDTKSTLIPYKNKALSDFSTNFSRSECIFIKKTGGFGTKK